MKFSGRLRKSGNANCKLIRKKRKIFSRAGGEFPLKARVMKIYNEIKVMSPDASRKIFGQYFSKINIYMASVVTKKVACGAKSATCMPVYGGGRASQASSIPAL
jgi:hypothetical protein